MRWRIAKVTSEISGRTTASVRVPCYVRLIGAAINTSSVAPTLKEMYNVDRCTGAILCTRCSSALSHSSIAAPSSCAGATSCSVGPRPSLRPSSSGASPSLSGRFRRAFCRWFAPGSLLIATCAS